MKTILTERWYYPNLSALRLPVRFCLPLLIFCFCYQASRASDVVEVIPLTNQILMVHFDDGYVDYHELGERREDETLYHIPLNVALADQLSSYIISSTDDLAYANGLSPTDLSRKSKGTAYLWLCESYQDGVGCTNTSDDHAKEHWIYVFLPEPMQKGKTYTIDLGNLAKNGSTFSVTYDDDNTRSEAVHVNNVGYDPAANAKYGYVYHWMGTKGGLDLSAYAGASFQLINQATGKADFTGALTFRKEADNQESPYQDQTPNGNFLGAEVYECDFSGFGGVGTYVLSVDGVGCSFPFELNSNVYDEVFYWTMKGLYQNRSGIALEAPYTDQPRSAPHNPNTTPGFKGQLKYTSFRYYDAAKSDNDKADKPKWEAGIKGDINTWGWYQDAGDWDAYSTHARVPTNLMFLYEVASQNFSDGQLNIPESGNGLPDLLDEARWLIRFYHRTRQAILEAGYGTGGVGGARVFGDLWGGDELEDGTTIGSWQDTQRLYVVSGEDPHMTYTYAGLAAQYAWILDQDGFTDPEGINWKKEAQEAWTWAKNNTKPGDEEIKFAGDLDLVASRMYAATALYRLTGNSEYHTQFIEDVASKQWTSTTVLEKDNRYSAWIYSLMDNQSKNTATAELAQEAVQYSADFIMLYHVDKRACRWAGNYFFPMLVGQGTTPMVNEGVMGYAIAKKTGKGADKLPAYKLFMQTTADYFLGTNPLNMTWLTGVGDRSPGEIFHLDSWYSGKDTPRKGIIPYGPWHDESSLGPIGPWNHKWANKTLTPNSVDQWPGHERWYDLRSSPFTSEFTVHQNNGVAAVVYGFLKNGPGSYRGGESSTPTEPTAVTTISTSSDDAEEKPDGAMNLSSDDLDLRSGDVSGMRFALQVPQGASINEATVSFVAKGNTSGANTFTFRIQAANNANTFTSSNGNLSGRNTSSSLVTWSPGSWTDEQTYTSPDLSGLVQEVVNRSGWTSGNSLVLLVSASNSNKRAARTYDYNGNSSQAPSLSVSYSNGGNPTPNPNPSTDAYRYLRLTFESGSAVAVQEVEWRVGGNSYPSSAVSSTGQANGQGVSVLGASWEDDYKLYNKVDNCTGGQLYINDVNLPKSVTLDLGSGKGIAPDGLIISKCTNAWSQLSSFKAEGSNDLSDWSLLGQFSGLTVNDFPGDVGTFSLGSGNARQGTELKKGVSTVQEALLLGVYPNPSTGLVQVQMPEAALVQVHNSVGQLVLEQEVQQGLSSLDLSKLGNGMHMVSTTIHGRRQVQRLILK